MRKLTYIDVERSIRRNRLIYKSGENDWSETIQTILFIGAGLVLLGLIVSLLLIELDKSSVSEKVIWFFPALLTSYVLFRKATEKRFSRLATAYQQKENNSIVLAFAKQEGLKVHRKSKDILLFNEGIDMNRFNNTKYKRSFIFIPTDHCIRFCVIQDTPGLNWPAMFNYWAIKWKMKKYFEKVAFTHVEPLDDLRSYTN